MGKAIFQTEIIELGEQVDAFFEEGISQAEDTQEKSFVRD